MSFLSKFFGTEADPKDELRPLWHWIVGEARNPQWYAQCGAADTVDGRFDMITSILAITMLRMEQEPDLIPASARLVELFVEDMEAQLRELGFGDPTLGKKMGLLMEAMGGRLGAYRDAIPLGLAATIEVVERNSNLGDNGDSTAMANRLIALSEKLAPIPRSTLFTGSFG